MTDLGIMCEDGVRRFPHGPLTEEQARDLAAIEEAFSHVLTRAAAMREMPRVVGAMGPHITGCPCGLPQTIGVPNKYDSWAAHLRYAWARLRRYFGGGRG